MNTDVAANGVFVGADSVSTLKSTSIAGAKGADEEDDEDDDDDEADEQADKAVAGAASLSDVNGSSNVKTGEILKKSSDRQKAQTSEGNVSVAAGFVLNIMDNDARAAIDGETYIRAVRAPGADSEDVEDGEEIYQQDMNGSINVVARNRTVGEIKANASTADAGTGIGAAVAIHILGIDNIARIGGAVTLNADNNITIRAEVLEAEDEDEDEDEEEDDSPAFQVRLEEALSDLIASLLDKMGLSQYSDKIGGGIASIVASVAGDFAKAMLTDETGLSPLLELSGPDDFVDQLSKAVTRASGFSMGKTTAVGASVAVNIIDTAVNVGFEGEAVLEGGTAYIAASSSNEDESNAIATAMGADMQRYTERFKKAEESAEQAANRVLSGDIYDGEDDEGGEENKTADSISSRLNAESDKSEDEKTDADKAVTKAPLSTNVLRTQSVSEKTNTSAMNEDVNDAADDANTATDKTLELDAGSGQLESSIQVAAAVGLTVSKHKVNTSIRGSINAANGIEIASGNEGNFRTLGTGLAMSLAEQSNAVAAAVAVSVNRNEANITVEDGVEIVSEDGGVTVSSNLSQNTTGADLAVLIDRDEVTSSVGVNGSTDVSASGDFRQSAVTESSIQTFSVAAAVGKKTTVGGNMNVVIAINKSTSELGANAHVDVGGNLDVIANTAADLLLVAPVASAALLSGAAVGGSVDVIMNRTKTQALVRENAVLTAKNDMNVHALEDVKLISVIAAVSASGGGHSIAGALGVLITKSDTVVDIANNSKLTATLGDLTLKAQSDSLMANAILSTAISLNGAGIGATVNVDIFKRSVEVNTNNAVLTAGRNLSAQALGKDNTVLVTAAVGAARGVAVAGTIPVTVAKSNILNTHSGTLRATAGGSIGFESDYRFSLVDAAGGIGFSLSGVSVGATLSVIIAGAKMSQDAHDTLYGGMKPEDQVNGSFDNANSAARAYKPTDTAQTMQGDGQKASGTNYGSYGQGGMVYESPNGEILYTKDSNNNYHSTGKTRVAAGGDPVFYYDSDSGEYVSAVETYDEGAFDSTANGGDGTSYSAQTIGNLRDSVTAVIGGGSTVKANRGIDVLSNDKLQTLIISGTAAGSGGAGVGVGLTVAILNSNVQARVDDGASLTAGGDIRVNANTGAQRASGSIARAADSVNPLTSDRINSSVQKSREDSGSAADSSTIRLISITAAGGAVGVAVSGAALSVFSDVSARMSGSVESAGSLSVTSGLNFGEVLTANLAAAGGSVGVAASIAMAYFQGKAHAIINSSSAQHINNVAQAINVSTTGSSNATVVAATLAVGGVAVNAGVLLALNRSEVGSTVGRNVSINSETAAMSVGHSFSSNAVAIPIAISGGGVAVGVTVSIAINKLNAASYVGASQSESQGSGSIRAASLSVYGNARGDVDVTGVSVSAGGVAVNGVVALGLNFVKNVAAVRRMPINLSGAMDVTATMNGVTDVTTTAITAGGVAVGASIDAAYIGASNEATVELGGDSTASRMTVTANSDPRATVLGITGGAGGVAVNVNLGLALNKGVNRALLGGSGNITLTGDGEDDGLIVQTNGGTGLAHTALYSAGIGGVSVNVSLALSMLKSTQEAKVDNSGTITVQNNRPVAVSAIQGTPRAHAARTFTDANGGNAQTVYFGDSMAKAYLFSAGAGLVSVNASGGVVISDSTNRASLKARNLTGGIVSVTGGGKSDANVKIDNIGIGVVSVGVMVGVSLAKGQFDTEASASGEWHIRSLLLDNIYTSVSTSDVTPAAGGVSVSLVNAGLNTAIAINNAKANTTLSGSGKIFADTVVRLRTESVYEADSPNANAIITKPSVDVSLVKVVANVAVAQNRSTQNTRVQNVSILGGTADVTIISDLRNAGAKSETKLSGGSGASVSLVGIDLNFAVAGSKTGNSISISGGSHNVNSISLRAGTTSDVVAYGKTPTSVGLVLLGALLTDARTSDAVSATVSNANVTTQKDFTIVATGNGNADATSESGMKVSLVSATSSSANAQVGAGSGDRQRVTAGISGGTIKVGRDLSIEAENKGFARANIKSGIEIGLVTVSVSVLPTESFYRTDAYLNGGTRVTTGRDLLLRAMDSTGAESKANSSSIGLGLSADVTKGTNKITSDSKISVSGTLDAGNAMTIMLNSITDMLAQTVSSGGGFVKGSHLNAENTLTRSGIIEIAGGSQLSADYGDLTIETILGKSYDGRKSDSINTTAKVSAGGVVTLSNVRTTTVIRSDSQVTVGSGVTIRDRFNSVNIRTDASQNGMRVYGSADASGLGTRPDVYNDVKLTLHSKVNIGGGSTTTIEGRKVYIGAKLGELNEYVYSYAKGSSLGAEMYATNNMLHEFTAETNVSYVTLIGHDETMLYANAEPTFRSENIHAEARVQLNAIGKAIAKNNLNGSYAKAKLNVGYGFTYYGASFDSKVTEFNLERLSNITKAGGFIKKETQNQGSFRSTKEASFSSPTLYLGDAAYGIFIDITEDGVRQVGVKNEETIWSVSQSLVTLGNISNFLPGTANLTGNVSGLTVYNQAIIPRVVIGNSTARGLTLSNIIFRNDGFVNPRVYLDGNSYSGYTVRDTTWQSELTVSLTGSGDITLNGLIPLYDGKALFEWTGEQGGRLLSTDSVTVVTLNSSAVDNTIRPLWARSLEVKGASQIDYNEENPFYAWIVSTDNQPDSDDVLIVADGDVYANLAAVQLYNVSSLDDAVVANANRPLPRLDLNNVTSRNGDVYIMLEEGRNLFMTDPATVSIPLPGSLEYDKTSQVTLAAEYTVSGLDMLAYYEIAYDPETGISTYLLPNGTSFYMDKEGNVTRIEEGDTALALEEYVFHRDESGRVYEIEVSPGVSIDLITGKLSIAEETSFEVLMEAIKATWLNERGLFNGAMKVRISLEDGSDKDFRVMKMSREWNNLVWYYMNLLMPDVMKSQSENNFMIAYDRANDQIHFYRVGKAETMNSESNEDMFKNLDISKGQVNTQDGNYRTTYSKDNAFWKTGTRRLSVNDLLYTDSRTKVYTYRLIRSGVSMSSCATTTTSPSPTDRPPVCAMTITTARPAPLRATAIPSSSASAILKPTRTANPAPRP